MKKCIWSCIIIVFFVNLANGQGIFKSLINKVAKPKEQAREYSYISEFHKKSVGKIVFYKKPLASFSGLNEQTLSTQINLSDTIKALAFDDVPILEYIKKEYPEDMVYKVLPQAVLSYNWYIDGKYVGKDFVDVGGFAMQNSNYYELGFGYNFGRWEEEPLVWRKFIRTNLSILTPGDHQIKLELFIGSKVADTLLVKEPIASGSFALTIKSNKIDPANTTICLPSPYQNKRDAKAEKAIMEAFTNASLGEPSKVILQAVFIENRNSIGALESRSSWATIAYKKDGKCMSASYVFKQNYGSAGYAEVELGRQLDAEVIDCDCLK